jgi:hypothetical protein
MGDRVRNRTVVYWNGAEGTERERNQRGGLGGDREAPVTRDPVEYISMCLFCVSVLCQ